VQRLATCGPALVDAGGDIAISGPRQEGEPWLIGIADPRYPGEQLALLTLGECGVATSGQDYRYWEHHGSRQHHIIDPRTGYPALSDIITVTAIAPTLFQAEIAAKTVFLLGSYEGLSWLNRRPDLEGLVVCESGDVLRSNQFHRYLWS
jgi:thiamine biosynthesis lipoprotein